MTYSKFRYACLVAAAITLTACKDHNPLLGEWTLERTPDITYQTFQVAKITGNGRLRFEEDRVVSGQDAVEVAYEINGDTVTVQYLASGRKATYEIIDDKAFFLEHPTMGRFKYVRTKHPTVSRIY